MEEGSHINWESNSRTYITLSITIKCEFYINNIPNYFFIFSIYINTRTKILACAQAVARYQHRKGKIVARSPTAAG
jgi:hypothetical protein